MKNCIFCIGHFARFIHINLPFSDNNTITIQFLARNSNAIAFTPPCYPCICPLTARRGKNTQGTCLGYEPANDFHAASVRRVVDWCQAASVHQVPCVEVVVNEYRLEPVQIVKKYRFKYFLAQVNISTCHWTRNSKRMRTI